MAKSKWFIFKKGYRTFTKNKAKTIPILLLMAFSIGFGATMLDLLDIRSRLVNNALKANNFPDGFVYFDTTPQLNVSELIEEISSKYFESFEFRMILLVEFEINQKMYEGLLIGINNPLNHHINVLVTENFEKINNSEFYINWNFANKENIKKDQEIVISLGTIQKEEKIKGIGFNPEFLYSSLYENIIFPSLKPYPVLYIDLKYLNDNFIKKPFIVVNQLIYRLKSNSTQESVEDAIEDYLGNFVQKILSQEDYPFVKTSREDEIQDRRYYMVFIFIFIIGSIITLIIVIYKLIANDLKSISIFQSLGANKSEIIGSYLVFNFILIMISMLIGLVINIIVNIPIILLVIDFLGIPYNYYIYWSISNPLYIGLILLTISLLSTFLIVKKTFKLDVQKVLKSETEFLKKKSIVEKIAKKMKKDLHPFTKYNLRRIFGKKIYLFFIIISLSLSFCIIILSYGFPDSMSYSVKRKVEYIERWDIVSTTWTYENQTEMDKIMNSLSEVETFEYGISDYALLSKKNSSFDDNIKIMSFQENAILHILEAENGEIIKDKNDILISKDLLSNFKLKIGNKIYIKNVASNISHEFKIIGAVNDMALETVFMSIEAAQDVLEQDDNINVIYITSRRKIDDTFDQVQDLPQIRSVIKINLLADDFNTLTEMYLVIFLVVGFILTIFGLILISIILKSIIEYRMEDYANMKAIGIYDFEIRNSLIKEVIFYLGVSIGIGIILGVTVTFQMVQSYSYILPGFYFNISAISYIYFSLNVFIIFFFSLLMQIIKIRKMNISEITKKKTFG